MATSVIFEQENLISPTKLSFRTIQRVSIAKGTSLSDSFSSSPMILWRDYLIGAYVKTQPLTRGLFLWSMRDNSIFYFEVCHSSFPFPDALNSNSGQMGFFPRCTKVLDDLLFTSLNVFDGAHRHITYRCIHIPSLVTSAQVPGGFLSLTENAFAMLLPKSIIEPRAMRSPFPVQSKIYPIPACTPTHPRYCFVLRQFLAQSKGVEWEVLEVEIDLSIPGPIKIFSKVSRQYTVKYPTRSLHDSDDDLFLHLPLGHGDLPCASLSIRFLQVGKPGKRRLARLEGVDKMRLTGLSVDRDAGYVILYAADHRLHWIRYCSFIWWLDERKPDSVVYSRTKELIPNWSRGLLRRL